MHPKVGKLIQVYLSIFGNTRHKYMREQTRVCSTDTSTSDCIQKVRKCKILAYSWREKNKLIFINHKITSAYKCGAVSNMFL